MGITFRHDAAAVALPANSASRKYGQQLVLQQQQQKYNAQQAGYDRLLQLGRDQQQNVFQAGRDQAQQAFIQGRDKAQNDFQVEQQQQQQRARDFEAARQRIDTYAKDSLSNPDIPQELRTKIQNLISGKMAVLGGGYDAPAQQEFLDQYNAQLGALLSEVPPPKPKPTREEELKGFLGPNYEQYKDQPWVPDGKGGFAVAKDALVKQQKEQELQQKAEQEAAKMRPKSFQDYYNENEDKFQNDLDATMKSLEKINPETGAVTTATPEEALAKMQQNYDFRQKALGRPTYGSPTAAPELPGAAQSQIVTDPFSGKQYKVGTDGELTPVAPSPSSGTSQSILEQQPIRPDSKLAEQARALGMDLNAPQQSPLMAQRPDVGMPPAPSGWSTMTREQKQAELTRLGASPQEIANDDASLDRSYAFHSQPIGTAQAPAQQQVKVGGKPLAVTPGTLTPQETAARNQVMAMPREQRIAALMKYDPQMKGRTLEQILEDPETKSQYDALTKQGLTTGNYREDILGHLDEILQNNVLNGPGTPPDAYVGMRADEVTDPKAKAEVAKMLRPKTPDELNGIRGPYFIDPNGVIRSTQKQN